MEFNELKEYYANLIRESLLGEATQNRLQRRTQSNVPNEVFQAAQVRDNARLERIGNKAYKGGVNLEQEKILNALGSKFRNNEPFARRLGRAMRIAYGS
jgi:hypothetical protein